MIGRLLARLPWFGDESEAGADGSGSRFVPSELDHSVREAHGAGRAAAERELASIDAQAELLEESEEQHER